MCLKWEVRNQLSKISTLLNLFPDSLLRVLFLRLNVPMKLYLLKIFYSLCALVPLSSFAVHYGHEVNDRLADLVNITGATAPDKNLPSCSKRYADLYKDGTLNITIGFGYWDNSPNEDVFDHYIANGLRNSLVTPCAPGVNVCGFKKQGDVYRKIVTGPDGKPNTLTIGILFGSLTKSNVDNTTKLKAQQDAQCEAATKNFFQATSGGSEVVMYIGHARDGGACEGRPHRRRRLDAAGGQLVRVGQAASGVHAGRGRHHRLHDDHQPR